MKFEKIEIEFEKYESLDIIAASSDGTPEETTQAPTTVAQDTDPYGSDKW